MGRPREELFNAAMAGDRDRLRKLLNEPNGADFSDPARAADAGRALSVAALYGDAGLIEELAAAGVPMDNTTQDFSALVEALSSDHAGDDAIKALIAGGADVNRQCHRGVCAISTAAFKGKASAMRLLIEAGAEVDTFGVVGETPLLMAIHRNGGGTVHILLEAGAQVNTKNDFGMTPLMKAAGAGLTPVVSALIKAGADVAARDKEGDGALYRAAIVLNLECAQALVAAGANPEAKNNRGKDMLDLVEAMSKVTPGREEFKLWAEGVKRSAREKQELAEAMSPLTEGPKASELIKRARP